MEKKEGGDGSRSILSSGFFERRVVTRARLGAARRSGSVATVGGRAVSSRRDISSDTRHVKV
jgi:hypothetical protein